MPNLTMAILVSGQGSVLKTVLRNCADETVLGRVAAVASNRDCPALEVARAAGVPLVRAYPVGDFPSRSARDAAMGADLRQVGVNLVVVGGYNESLEKSFFDVVGVDAISMYPALLPAFGELPEAIGPALDYGVKTIGVTIHFRTPLSGSSGPIIAQEPLPVDIGDTVAKVTERVITLEAEFLPQVLQAFAEGRVVREGSRVRVRPPVPRARLNG
jgi:phosphoribosylglycinamide formyltransferase-1